MCKITGKKSVGQPILKQRLVRKHNSDYYYKVKCRILLITVCCTLIAQLLLTIIHMIAQTIFIVVATFGRMHLISVLDVSGLLKSQNRSHQIGRGSPDATFQRAIFSTKIGEVNLRNEKPMSCL
jgi:hypothetical protein